MKTVYVDNNATTAVLPEVMEAITPHFTREFFNPSAISGRISGIDTAVERSRRTVAEFLGASDTREIAFTSCATESNNWAIFWGGTGESRSQTHYYIHSRASGRFGGLQIPM